MRAWSRPMPPGGQDIPGATIDERAFGPAQASRAVREYLEGIDADGRPQTMRRNISITDPAAEWTCAPGGPAFFAYSTNYLIDVRAGVIVDVEATSAQRTQEVDATRTMIDRVERRFAIRPTRLIGDMAYGAAELLGWMVNDKAIEPHVPVWDRTRREDLATFEASRARARFVRRAPFTRDTPVLLCAAASSGGARFRRRGPARICAEIS